MRLKQTVTLCVLAALSASVFVASADTVPVAKDGYIIPIIDGSTINTEASGSTINTDASVSKGTDTVKSVKKSTANSKELTPEEQAEQDAQEAALKALAPADEGTSQYADHNSLAYRVSSTASPEQNRMMRDVAGRAVRDVKSVVAPDANAYFERKQVGISSTEAVTDHLDIVFPTVTSVSGIVEKNINDTIKKYVSKVQNNVEKLNSTEENKTNVIMYYDVKRDSDGILSLLIHSYMIQDQAANGVNYVKGFTFNTTTGRQLSLYDMGGINATELNQAIDNNADVKTQLGSAFTGVEKVPSEFYVVEGNQTVMILQQEDVTPHSAGTVYVPVGNLRNKDAISGVTGKTVK